MANYNFFLGTARKEMRFGNTRICFSTSPLIIYGQEKNSEEDTNPADSGLNFEACRFRLPFWFGITGNKKKALENQGLLLSLSKGSDVILILHPTIRGIHNHLRLLD